MAAAVGSPARDDLVERHLHVASSVARRYRGRGIELDDLVQVARMALVGASRRFDPDRGYDFLAFAVPSMHGELKRHFRDHGWVVKPPRGLQELHERALRRRVELTQELGHEPDPRELAADLQEPVASVTRALDLDDAFRPTSLDRTWPDADEATVMGMPDAVDEDAIALVEARVLLRPVLAGLSDRERLLLVMRFVDGSSQQEIGAALGVTQSQVSRLLRVLLVRLRAALDAPRSLLA